MDYRVVEHPDFIIHAPLAWLDIPSPQFEAVFVAPPFPDGPGTNVSVAIINYATPTTIQMVGDELKTLQQSQYPDYSILDEGLFEFPHAMSYRRKYTWLNTAQEIAISQDQIIFADESGHKVGVLTATRPSLMSAGEIEVFEHLFFEMAASFRLHAAE